MEFAVLSKKCRFYNLERNCKDERCNIVWHYSLLSKVFSPLFPLPRSMINEITPSLWSHSTRYDNNFLTASNVLFLLVCVLPKCFPRRLSCISDFYFQSVFADIPNSAWNVWTHQGALGPGERKKWTLYGSEKAPIGLVELSSNNVLCNPFNHHHRYSLPFGRGSDSFVWGHPELYKYQGDQWTPVLVGPHCPQDNIQIFFCV